MPTSRVSRIILLVSCAHALVHLLEQSIASVEQVISSEFSLSLEQSGWLGAALRLPYGLGAWGSGLLADRFGEKRILVLYLLGSAVVSASFVASNDASVVYVQLLTLGAFASMYHPAGLSLLAGETTPAQRARALGTHGVFGSLGIAAAPFLAGLMLSSRPNDWRGYYLILSALAAVLACLVWSLLKVERRAEPVAKLTTLETNVGDGKRFQLWPYTLLVTGTALSGTVYAGVLHFLPRYLMEAGVFESRASASAPSAAMGNYAAALALVCGAFGQWFAGRIARPASLKTLLVLVYAANIPCLIWMTVAEGTQRLVAACLWAFVHFMNQPIYNSLLPEYLPAHRRSTGFGFSNMMGFGIGAAGPPLVALCGRQFTDYTVSYSVLGVLAFLAAVMPLVLVLQSPQTTDGNG